MLSNLRNILKVPDLRNKIIFTLVVIAIYQLGTYAPVPGVSFAAVQKLVNLSKNSGILGFLDLFSGGALTRMSVFGLGIMPYITSSIIIQLLATVIPKFEEWRDQGPAGQKKLTQVTRYLTVTLALMQSTGLAYAFHNGGAGFFTTSSSVDLFPHFDIGHVAFFVLTMTAGTAFVMWLGELITQRGIGQGMSILIFANVVAFIVPGGHGILAEGGNVKFIAFIALAVVLMVAIVAMELGQRRIPVTFAKRVVGRQVYGGQSTYVPLKVNQAGVIPVIFATSILYFPVLLSNIVPSVGLRSWINSNLAPTSLVYIGMYSILIFGFTFFYATVTFDPYQNADVIRKQGGYIPGIRPGRPTETYLAKTLNRITFPGALFLVLVAVTPSLLLALWKINTFPFAGTTLLIAAGVALETMKQVDSQLMMRNYEGFLRQ